MCGRFSLNTPTDHLASLFDFADGPSMTPRFNIAPTQSIATVRVMETRADRECVLLRWGLIPSWSREPKSTLLNACSETVAVKPSFRSAFRKRRCLIPADAFYEWKKVDGKKQPYAICLRDEHPFAFAGLWESWRNPEGDTIESATILTTSANELVRPIHERMPVILQPTDYSLWLDPEMQNPDLLHPLLKPYAANQMKVYPVSTWVNNAKHEGPRCLAPEKTLF